MKFFLTQMSSQAWILSGEKLFDECLINEEQQVPFYYFFFLFMSDLTSCFLKNDGEAGISESWSN